MTQIPDEAVQAASIELSKNISAVIWTASGMANSDYAMRRAITAAIPLLPLGFDVKQLEWFTAKGYVHDKMIAIDCFGNEFFRIDLNGISQKKIEERKADAQADFERRVRECLVAKPVEVLDDASIQAKVSEIGNQIHNLGCEYQNTEDLSDRLKEIRDQLWDISKNCTKPVDVAVVRERALEEVACRFDAEALKKAGAL